MKQETWIEKLPDLDRQALINLCSGKLNELSKPREMNFVLYDFLTESQIKTVRAALEEDGFKVSVYNDVNQPGMRAYTVEAQKSNFIINPKSYIRHKQLFERLAAENDVHYDGWYASQ